MKFTKMQGIGNDYVYVNCLEEEVADPTAVARFVSNRNFGIGSDGLILILPSHQADFRMRMFNMDGSEGAMCGNGIRCVGKYVYDHGLTDQTELIIETKSGLRKLKLKVEEGRVHLVTVDMGEARLISAPGESIMILGERKNYTGIDVGNPHAVYFVEDVDSLDLERVGPAYEHHPNFPNRVNSEFVQVISDQVIKMRVWERGSGETRACGTGATASAAACMIQGYTGDQVKVQLLGGDLVIHRNPDNHHMEMTGPAVEVFHGEILINEKGKGNQW